MVEEKKIPDGYKMSEVGVIPNEWDTKRIEEIAKIDTGKKNTEDKDENGIYDFFVRSQKVEKINSYSFDGEAVLTAGDGVGVGKVFHYVNGKFNYHQRVYKISNFDDVDGKYFFEYFRNYFLNQVSKYTAKTSVDSVRLEMISRMYIPIPSLKEQKLIAKVLSDTNDLILSLEKLINKKKSIKQGIMQELLTGKKRLDGFTEKWYKISLGEICDIKDGTHQTPKYVDYGVPFYSVENVTKNDFINTKFICEEEHKLLTKAVKIEKGDILMTRIGSIGDCKYVDWDVNASFYVSLALLKVKKTISAEFLTVYSKSEFFKKQVEINSLQFAIPKKINLLQISNILVNIPKSLGEQKAIAKVIFNMDKEIEALQKKLDKYKKIKEGMMEELLTGKRRLV